MIVSANTLLLQEVFTFDGSAELDGSFSIFSGDAPDSITGSQGADVISGRGAVDTLTGEGGDDVFLYANITDSQGLGDWIMDFTTGDKISFSNIDADTATTGNQAFTFIGSAEFSTTPGEVRAVNTGGDTWVVEANDSGDQDVDVIINVVMADGSVLDASDFIL